MNDKLIQEHAFYKYAEQVRGICEDLFTHTPIRYFSVGRAYRNGDYGGLLSNKAWGYHYLKNDFQKLGVEHQLASQLNNYSLWNLESIKPTCEKTQSFYDACLLFKIGTGVIFVTECPEYYEAVIITTENDAYHNDPFIVENINLLKQFILYFKEKVHSNKELCNAFCTRYKNDIHVNPVEIKTKNQIEFPIKKYYIGGAFENLSFSKREAECLKHLSYGKTSKQIAKILNLSPRTIETHLENIKAKTHSANLTDLIKKLESCTLLDGI